MRALTEGWPLLIGLWVTALAAAGAARTTQRTRAAHLSRAAKVLGGDPLTVTREDLVAYVAAQEWARETRRSVTSSLRSFYGWACQEGYLEGNPALGLPRVAPAAIRPRPAPEAIYRQALAAGTSRERMILRLAAEVGLRRAEIAQVHTRDLRDDLNGWSLLVHGKGNRERVVPLTPGLALEVRARGPGYLFPGDDGGHLSPRWVGKLATRVMPDDWTLHTLRHRFATRAYGLERDLLVVQTILGHSSPATTRRYVLVDDDRVRDTMRRVSNL